MAALSRLSLALAAAGLATLAFGQFTPAPRSMDEGLGVFDGKGSFYSVTNRYLSNAYFQVTKLTSSGAMVWNVPYNPGQDAGATALAVDKQGNLIVAGTLRDQNVRDLLVAKFTPDGAFYWKHVYQAGGNAVPTLVGADPDGNIYVAATVSDPTGSHLLVTRYGPSGALYWGLTYKIGRTNYPRALLVDGSGHAHITVETTLGNEAAGYYETRMVLFTSYGAVVPQ